MQKEQDPNSKIDNEDVWTSTEFTTFLSEKFPTAATTKYFIQLNLLSDYFMFLSIFTFDTLSKRRGFQYHVHKSEIDDQLHILSIYIKKNQTQGKMKVLLIQMDRLIKLTFQSCIANEKKFKTTNQLVFDYTIYMNKKVANSYGLLKSLKKREIIFNNQKQKQITNQRQQSQLNYLYLARGLQSIIISVKSSEQRNGDEEIINQMDYMKFFNTKKNWIVGKCFLNVLSNPDSLMRIASFLNIRQISRLSRINRLLRNYFFTPTNIFYKTLYEFSYGRTGFDVNQMDWVKSLAKKRLQKAKQKHNKFRETLIFRTH